MRLREVDKEMFPTGSIRIYITEFDPESETEVTRFEVLAPETTSFRYEHREDSALEVEFVIQAYGDDQHAMNITA
ncbi:hypothetical protein OSTOST_01903, partial [Ostertagia ostertagi]